MDELEELKRRQARLEEELGKLKEEINRREVSTLKWGIRILGSIVIALSLWAWSQVEHMVSLSIGRGD